MDKTYEDLLNKMFEMVGETYTPEYVKEEGWFLKHTWTQEQESEFINWAAKYFRAKKTNIQSIPKFINHFVFNYGWKYDK